MTKKIKLPEGEVEFGTKEEALWSSIVDATKFRIKDKEEALIVERAFLEMAEKKLKESK